MINLLNKRDRSLFGSRSEAQKIFNQRQTIKRLEKENKELKEFIAKQGLWEKFVNYIRKG